MMMIQRALLVALLGATVVVTAGCTDPGPKVVDEDAGVGGKADTFGELIGCQDGRCLRDRDALPLIESVNSSLSDDDRDQKYCAMSESPFVFFRGTNHLYWHDLGQDPRLTFFGEVQGDGSTRIWIQGDLHVENFGAFDDDEGDVVYALNDFDESVIADYQLDLWRMATSLVLVAADLEDFDADDLREVIDAFGESYLDAVADFRGNDDEDSAVATAENAYGRLDDFLRDVEESNSRREMLDEWTVVAGGERSFDWRTDELEQVGSALAAELVEAVTAYQATLTGGIQPSAEYFAVKDVARRLGAGTGSLGTPRYYVLIEGETDDPDDDRILDVKRQGPPSADAELGPAPELEGVATNEAHRVVLAQQAFGVDTDDHVGWLELSDGVYSVRERSPFKSSFPLDELTSLERFVEMSEQWGAILAAAHCRADQDFDGTIIGYSFDRNVDVVTDGHHSELRQLLFTVAVEYALQATADYEAFVDELDAGSLCRRE